VNKLTKLVDIFTFGNDKVVSKEFEKLNTNYEKFKKQQLHSSLVQKNYLAALQKKISNFDSIVDNIGNSITKIET